MLRKICCLTALALLSCRTQLPTTNNEPVVTFSSDRFLPANGEPQCKGLLDSYCDALYSPKARGNLKLQRKQTVIDIYKGETQNQHRQVFYRYSLAKIQNQQQLPKDLLEPLQRGQYFEKLKDYLERKPRAEMSLQDRLAAEQLAYELNAIWSTAMNEAVIKRMTAQYPGYHSVPDKLVPIEWELEKRRIRRRLISSVSQALWRNDTNWKKVEQNFAKLQNSFTRMVARLDIPDSIRADWVQRIADIQLVLPGALPAFLDDECSTVKANAYYYTNLNMLTVCAGDFNSEDIMQTLAHEMAHSLGIDRTQYLFQVRSQFGQAVASMRKQVCEPKKFSCESWSEFKNQFPALLASLQGYQPELPQFQQCLKRRETKRVLTPEDFSRIARNMISDRVSDLASSDRFLRIVKSDVPMLDGKVQKNPNYLNPCSYYLWSQGEEPVDDDLTTLMFFTAEYRCSDEKEAPQRLKDAIEVAKELSVRVLESVLQIEGEFSAQPQLEHEGFSSPPYERFADVLGSYALAEQLMSVTDVEDRRNRFLASTSWLCTEPSVATYYPEESAIEKAYIFDAHTEGEQRRKELFSAPLRSALQCEKDFEFRECTLPFKQGLKER